MTNAAEEIHALGHLVIGDTRYPIVGITMSAGTIFFRATVPGPIDPPRDRVAFIEAPDGSVVFAGRWNLDERQRRDLSLVTPDGYSSIVYPVQVLPDPRLGLELARPQAGDRHAAEQHGVEPAE